MPKRKPSRRILAVLPGNGSNGPMKREIARIQSIEVDPEIVASTVPAVPVVPQEKNHCSEYALRRLIEVEYAHQPNQESLVLSKLSKLISSYQPGNIDPDNYPIGFVFTDRQPSGVMVPVGVNHKVGYSQDFTVGIENFSCRAKEFSNGGRYIVAVANIIRPDAVLIREEMKSYVGENKVRRARGLQIAVCLDDNNAIGTGPSNDYEHNQLVMTQQRLLNEATDNGLMMTFAPLQHYLRAEPILEAI
jgi:hypothetical protein